MNEDQIHELTIKATAYLTEYGLKIIAALLIYIIGKMIVNVLANVAERVMNKSKTDPTVTKFAKDLIYFILMTVVILAALSKLGIQTTSLVAIIGAAGLAIGLSLQGSLSNFASGVMILILKPFKVGDFIDAAGVKGVVEKISILYTELKTPDNKKIISPNSTLTSGHITNFSAMDTRRIDLIFGVSYTANLDLVKKTIQAVIDADDRILKDPETTIGVLELAESSVNFAVRPWVKSADYWNVFFHLNETMKRRFDEVGIVIPYPQRDVHLHNHSN